MSIDYMVPAKFTFPSDIKKVGVVNNVNSFTDAKIVPTDSVSFYNSITKTDYFRGNSKLATESLAEALAEENYFDLVLINDSALRANDIFAREAKLSQTEVKELASSMNVDMIVALEDFIIKSVRKIVPLYYDEFWGTVDANVYTQVSLYIPERQTAMTTITAKDSVFWETYRSTPMQAMSSLISEEKLIEESSVVAGQTPVKLLLPYWETSSRFYYANGSADLRDAATFVSKNQWDDAYALWKKTYDKVKDKKKSKKKMMSAYNIALYYEMKDDYENAILWANEALEAADKVEKVSDKKGEIVRLSADETPNYRAILLYNKELDKRKENFVKLNIQTERLKTE